MWSPIAQTLLIEIRKCHYCGTKFSAPALEPRVKVENQRGERITISREEYTKHLTNETRLKWFGFGRLPREVEYVELEVSQCFNCFAENEEKTERKREALRDYNTSLQFAVLNEEKKRERDRELEKERHEQRRRELYAGVNATGAKKRKKGSGGHKQKSKAEFLTIDSFE